ncbi:M56 family metallopeptidase [Amycolatopsis sp. CA-230715]|uniref:M56 family metallopeptidase n=1 Tax=Amycolatopsis sp. CA-230715 TaxID=2745196 RepID=UPI001C01CEBE|nr:M56 family metallopeptidase [Amycolatopsis sp. CA-230715]QWF82306.1 Protease HtpX [Amycolatopsis sp. CA-230715]
MTAPRRPAPFLLPSGTSSAFLLLISVVFTISTLWHPALFNVLFTPSKSPDERAAYARCVAAIFAVPGRILASSPECAPIVRGGGDDGWMAMLLVFAVLCLLTAAQYWFGPVRRIRRRRLRPIDRDVFPALREHLDRTAAEFLPRGRVEFLLDVVNPAVDGLAFGRAGRRYIALSRGMLVLFERDPALFKAVLLHEMAHVRNRDLDITAVVLALWRAFLVVILAPGLLGAVVGILVGMPPWIDGGMQAFVSGPGLSWLFAAQLVALTGLAWLTRYTVLQARELHADARVLTWWPEAAAPLRRLFDAVPRRRWSLAELRRRTHPRPGTRVAALTGDGPLLRQGFAFSFALGACFSLSMDVATSMSGQLRQGAFYWPAEVFVLVLGIALGIRELRAAAYAEAAGGLRARFGLAIGLPVGWAMAPSRMTDHAMAPFPVGVQLAALLVLAAAGWFLGLWVERVMAAWTPKVRAADRPVRVAAVPVAFVVVVLLLAARTVYETQYLVIIAHLTQDPAVSDPVLLALAVAQRWLFSHFAASGWLPLTVALLVLPLLARPRTPFRPIKARTLLIGLVVGVAVTALSVAFLYSSTVDILAFGCGFGAGVAAATAVWARAAPVLKGVLAASVVGVFTVVSLAAVMPMSWKLMTFASGQVLEVALLAGLVTTALRSPENAKGPSRVREGPFVKPL